MDRKIQEQELKRKERIQKSKKGNTKANDKNITPSKSLSRNQLRKAQNALLAKKKKEEEMNKISLINKESHELEKKTDNIKPQCITIDPQKENKCDYPERQ